MKKVMILFLFLAFSMQLKAFDPIEIIKKTENNFKGKSSKGTFTMKVVRPNFTREVKMKSWWKDDDKALIEIIEPQKEKGNKTLKIGNEIWNYLSQTETTIKIPPSMMLQSWNGSDLTNDDLVRESTMYEDYNIEFLYEEDIAGVNCWKFELTPKPNAPVVWGKVDYWVRKDDLLPAKIEYYDESGEKHRTMKFSSFKQMDGRKIPTVWKIINNRENNEYTEFIYNDVNFNARIQDRIFSFRELER